MEPPVPREDLPPPRKGPPPPPPPEEDPNDASLIRWTLSLSVAERLALLQRNAAALARLASHAADER